MNTIFTLGPFILEQGSSGVPIGCCLSAPKSELWAMWREHMALSEKTDTFQQEWQDALNKAGLDAMCAAPGPQQVTPLSGQGDFVRFSGIWAHRNRQQAPDRSPLHGHTCPAYSFWPPMNNLWHGCTLMGGRSRLYIPHRGMELRWGALNLPKVLPEEG